VPDVGHVARFYRHHLPHWRIEEAITTYFVTWRLSPQQTGLTPGERDVVTRAPLHFNSLRYTLLAFVIMDDHIHAVLTPAGGVRLESSLHSWKS
jgi:REP element-mobilizing transposase RayT